jgi:hypothetical protein
VRREPDDRVRADDGARLGDGHVVLADVHAVGPGADGEVRPVVEQQRHVGGGAQRAGALGDAQDVVVARVLHAQLEEVDAAASAGARARSTARSSPTRYSRARARRSALGVVVTGTA